MIQLTLALKLEGMWQLFRRLHGIGNGGANRKKFLGILWQQFLDEEMPRNGRAI